MAERESRQRLQGLDADVGRRIKALRKAQRISQSNLIVKMALLYGIQWHQSTVTNVERGERPLKLSEALAVADVLGVSLDALLIERASKPGLRELQGVADYVSARLSELQES
jgi:transcriptional regulator with XRE-family HTH domain